MPAFGGDVPAADKAAATVLFEDARTLFEQGKLAESLAKYEASHRIDPTAGKLLNIARCQEKLGLMASAWGSVHDAETLAKRQGDAERREFATKWKNELAPKLARLRIELAPGAEGRAIRLDGKPILPGALSAALPVDPGRHLIEADAGSTHKWHVTVRIEAKPGTTTIRVPASPAEPPPPFWNSQRVAGVALGGVAVAGFVVGAVFGIRAKNAMDESMPHCKDLNPDPCDSQGVALRDSATVSAWASNIAIGTGAVALGTGIVLFLTAPSAKRPAPSTAVRIEVLPVATTATQGLLVRGTW